MTTRHELLSDFPETILLDERWDAALVGVGNRGSDLLIPVYEFRALFACCAGPPWQRANQVTQLLQEIPQGLHPVIPALLIPFDRSEFWSKARQRRLIVLDRLNTAIQGLGIQPKPSGVEQFVVYSWLTSMEIMMRETHMRVSDENEFLAAVMDYGQENVFGPDRGPHTPLFIR